MPTKGLGLKILAHKYPRGIPGRVVVANVVVVVIAVVILVFRVVVVTQGAAGTIRVPYL